MDEKKNKATVPEDDLSDLTPEAIEELSNGKGDDDDE